MVISGVLSCARVGLVALLLSASCATSRPWSGNLKLGVGFLAGGAASMAVGAGLFGAAQAEKPKDQDTPNLKVFLPGVALFGIGIPFFVTGAVFTITETIRRPK